MGPRTPRRKKSVEPKDRNGAPGLEEELLQRYAHAGTQLLADESPKRLDPSLRSEMETITGADLSDVRLHTGIEARRMASTLGARAFAAGPSDVFFGRGEFDPATPRGRSLLAHELTHVAEGEVGLARVARRPERERLEVRARRVEEMVLAREQASQETPESRLQQPAAVQLPQAASGESSKARTLRIDKVALEEKIWQRLEREMKRHRERTGHL